MRISTSLMIINVLMSPLMAWSQSTSSVMIPVDNKTVQVGADFSQIDLLKEMRKIKPALKSTSIEIQMVRFEAKSSVGGGQVFLKINSDLVSSSAIETNPDVFASSDSSTFDKVEIRNIDRTQISTAALVIQNYSSLKIKNLEVIMGAAQEPVIFGHYADQQAQVIGGAINNNQDTRPTNSALANIYATYYGTSAPAVLPVAPVATQKQNPIQTPAPAPVKVVAAPPATPVATAKKAKSSSQCLQSSSGKVFCIGDIVKNAWGFDQKIIAIDAGSRQVTLSSDLYAEPYRRSVDML